MTSSVDAVLTITLSRPEALNAIDSVMSAELHAALDGFEADDTLRVAVITGKGRAFCAGSDLNEIGAAGRFDGGLAAGNVFSLVRRSHAKPLVAAVNGLAYGGGMELILACDIAIAHPTATFGLPEVKHGLVAAAGGLVRGPRQLPVKVVMDMALTGEPISATQALTWGLVSRIDTDPVGRAQAIAATIASHPSPIAIEASKAAIYKAQDSFLDASSSAWDAVEPALLEVLRRR